MTITAPSAESQLVLNLEQFINKADAFLQNYYAGGSDSSDVEKILKAVKNLSLDVDDKALDKEFEFHCDRKDLEADYYDSAWY
jgi:hypothetical protein